MFIICEFALSKLVQNVNTQSHFCPAPMKRNKENIDAKVKRKQKLSKTKKEIK